MCHLACKPANATNNITWLCHCPHSISASKSLCSLNGGCRVFAHHARKNHSDDSKLSFDPGSEYNKERNFRSSLFLWLSRRVQKVRRVQRVFFLEWVTLRLMGRMGNASLDGKFPFIPFIPSAPFQTLRLILCLHEQHHSRCRYALLAALEAEALGGGGLNRDAVNANANDLR